MEHDFCSLVDRAHIQRLPSFCSLISKFFLQYVFPSLDTLPKQLQELNERSGLLFPCENSSNRQQNLSVFTRDVLTTHIRSSYFEIWKEELLILGYCLAFGLGYDELLSSKYRWIYRDKTLNKKLRNFKSRKESIYGIRQLMNRKISELEFCYIGSLKETVLISDLC